MGNPGYTLEQALQNYTPDTNSGCWLWLGAYDTDGYGIARWQGKYKAAHRLFYENHIGEIPKGLIVMHTCDVTGCVNPKHLKVGTFKDNSQDMVIKGRSLVGEKNPQYGKPGTCLGRIGNKHPMFGKHHTEESKAKTSAALLGKPKPRRNYAGFRIQNETIPTPV